MAFIGNLLWFVFGGTGFVNFLWVILAGLWLAISHTLAGIGYCITIIGIPFKLAGVCFAPLGKKPVSR